MKILTTMLGACITLGIPFGVFQLFIFAAENNLWSSGVKGMSIGDNIGAIIFLLTFGISQVYSYYCVGKQVLSKKS